MGIFNLRSGTKLLSITFLSIVFVVGSATTSARAHCAGKHTGDHPHCAGGEPPASALKQEIMTIQDAEKQRQRIVVMNADGTDVQVVFVGERHARFRDVSWSGDGSKVLFRGEVNGQTGIHWVQVFELDGDGKRVNFAPGEPVFVTTTINANPHARWSPTTAPDGKEWIAYWDTTEPTWQIWLVDPYEDSFGQHEKIRLSSETNTTRDEYQPTWSPNADRIGFLSGQAVVQCSCPGDVEILELAVDGSGKLAITNTVSLIVNNPLLPNEFKDQLSGSPFWSTDWANNADWIATRRWSNEPEFHLELWVFPTDPSDVELNAKVITNDDPEVSYHTPVWSPGDDALLFTREGSGGVCNVPDNNDQPALQGGPSSRVIAPLIFNSVGGIDELDICNNVTFPFDLVSYDYEWWRGDDGLPPPPAP